VESQDNMNIGLIAGGGQFPIIFSKAARENGMSVYAIAHHNETDPQLEKYVDHIIWLYIGQLNKIIKFFKSHNVTSSVMMGSIKKARLFKDLRPDFRTLSLIKKIKSTHDDNILRTAAGVFEDEGIHIEAATFILPDILANAGYWTKKKPSKEQLKDIELGWDLSKQIGKLDIGQCIVIQKGSVLAVEAIDGTDATIKRGGKLGGGEAVLVKTCKPNQDLRFDIPAIGLDTVMNMKKHGVKVLVIEAGKAVVFDKQEMIHYADQNKLIILSK